MASKQTEAMTEDLAQALGSIIEEFAQDKADQSMCADPHTLGRINRARGALAAYRAARRQNGMVS